MKRLFFIVLLLIPSLAFGAFTEFYCNASTGSNLNSGSDAGTSVYTSASGNWSTSTHIFTPTDGSNPATASPGVTVGQFASIYVNGATTTVFIARVTAVTNATNGAITVIATSGAGTAGTPPSTASGTITIKVGGCWKGPNGADGFPLAIASNGNIGGATNTAGNTVRVNFKNNASYSITAQIALTAAYGVYQGYSSTVGDLGKATLDSGTSTGTIFASGGQAGMVFADWIFQTSITTGSGSLITETGWTWLRDVFHGSRGYALVIGASTFSQIIECEFYDFNKSNSAGTTAIQTSSTSPTLISYSYFHDATAGTNATGIVVNNSTTVKNCIFDTLGGNGIAFGAAALKNCVVEQSDFYKMTGDAINVSSGASQGNLIIRNNNFIKNGGKGINCAAVAIWGLAQNNGYGAGTQANGSADTLNSIVDGGTSVTYGSGVTPWFAPATGDFRISLSAANFAGRGAFTQTGNSKTGTVGFPDIGAAQSKIGSGGTFSKEISSGFAQ